jgi:hypothetical protein
MTLDPKIYSRGNPLESGIGDDNGMVPRECPSCRIWDPATLLQTDVGDHRDPEHGVTAGYVWNCLPAYLTGHVFEKIR